MMKTQWGDYQTFQLSAGPLRAVISDLGATLLALQVPDRDGQLADVVLGYDSPEQYLQGQCFLGAIVGPWANRIAKGRFQLNGETVQLDGNERGNHLHGGSAALQFRRWQVVSASENQLQLTTHVTKGTAGYPANIAIAVCYELSELGLVLRYEVTCDEPCPINMTAHPYFNLSGTDAAIDDHELMIRSNAFLAIDNESIPEAMVPVVNTPFDLRQPQRLADQISQAHPQLQVAKGFDHCWLLDGAPEFREVAVLSEPQSGRVMSVWTDQPGIQCYTGQYVPSEPGKHGNMLFARAGLCLETECYPDQVNSDLADDCILQPGKIYRQHTEYRFSYR